MEITIITDIGKKISEKIKSEEKVSNLKNQLSLFTGIPDNKLILYCNSKELLNDSQITKHLKEEEKNLIFCYDADKSKFSSITEYLSKTKRTDFEIKEEKEDTQEDQIPENYLQYYKKFQENKNKLDFHIKNLQTNLSKLEIPNNLILSLQNAYMVTLRHFVGKLEYLKKITKRKSYTDKLAKYQKKFEDLKNCPIISSLLEKNPDKKTLYDYHQDEFNQLVEEFKEKSEEITKIIEENQDNFKELENFINNLKEIWKINIKALYQIDKSQEQVSTVFSTLDASALNYFKSFKSIQATFPHLLFKQLIELQKVQSENKKILFEILNGKEIPHENLPEILSNQNKLISSIEANRMISNVFEKFLVNSEKLSQFIHEKLYQISGKLVEFRKKIKELFVSIGKKVHEEQFLYERIKLVKYFRSSYESFLVELVNRTDIEETFQNGINSFVENFKLELERREYFKNGISSYLPKEFVNMLANNLSFSVIPVQENNPNQISIYLSDIQDVVNPKLLRCLVKDQNQTNEESKSNSLIMDFSDSQEETTISEANSQNNLVESLHLFSNENQKNSNSNSNSINNLKQEENKENDENLNINSIANKMEEKEKEFQQKEENLIKEKAKLEQEIEEYNQEFISKQSTMSNLSEQIQILLKEKEAQKQILKHTEQEKEILKNELEKIKNETSKNSSKRKKKSKSKKKRSNSHKLNSQDSSKKPKEEDHILFILKTGFYSTPDKLVILSSKSARKLRSLEETLPKFVIGKVTSVQNIKISNERNFLNLPVGSFVYEVDCEFPYSILPRNQ